MIIVKSDLIAKDGNSQLEKVDFEVIENQDYFET